MACSQHFGGDSCRTTLRCSVCLDDYNEPKVLPCCHTFCKPCLLKLSEVGPGSKAEGSVTVELAPGPRTSITVGKADEHEAKQAPPVVLLSCPQCRARHQIVGGVDNLLTNFSIVDKQNKLMSSSLKAQDNAAATIHCGLCASIDPVVSYCTDCSSVLCAFCHKVHQRLKLYHCHHVRKVEDVDKSVLAETACVKSKGQLTCIQHPNEVPQIFCKSCDELVCCQCIVDQHDGHKFARIDSNTRSELESKLRDVTLAAKNNLQSLEDDLAYVKAVESVTNEMGTKHEEDIKKMFDSFIATLQKRRDELLSKSEQHHNAKLKTLWSEKDYLENLIASLKSCLKFSEQLQTCTNAGEFIALASRALQNLQVLKNTSWMNAIVEKAHRSYLNLEMRKGEPKVYKNAIQCSEITTYHARVKWKEFPAKVSLGSEHKAIVCVTRNNDDTPYIVYNKPSSRIQHLESGTCDVADISIYRCSTPPGAWEVKFVPYCGGRHTCTVNVANGNLIAHDFDVTGVPPVGSRVMRGPSWRYSDLTHSYGASGDEVAVVENHNTIKSEKTLCILWSDNKHFLYKWGQDDKYDIQLYH